MNKQKKPAVSVIIPVYNVEKYLDKCILSVLDQTLQDFEIVLVNDGSTDNSKSVIEQYALKHTNISVVTKENGGLSSARNAGLKIAQGEYITFLDSDDYIEKNYLEKLYTVAKEKDRDMVVCGQYKVSGDGQILSEILYPVQGKGQCALRKMNIAGKLYKRDYIEKHHIRFGVGKIYEDNPFNFVALFLAKNIIFLEYAGYYQVVRNNSITAKKIDDNRLPYIELENAVQYVLKHQNEINDPQLFEFTFISFLTYFIFQANKAHRYIKLKNRKSDWEVVRHFCDFSLQMLEQYFPKYYINQYLGIFTNYKLPIIQKLGTWAFAILCRTHLLKTFAKIYYMV